MKLKCPHCGVEGTADDSLAGRTVRCSKCDKRFVARFQESPQEKPVAAGTVAEQDSVTDERPVESSQPVTSELSTGPDSSELLAVTCPHCGTAGRVEKKLLGKEILCPHCSYRFTAGGEVIRQSMTVDDGIVEPPEPAEVEDVSTLISADSDFSIMTLCKEAFHHSFKIRFSLLCWAVVLCLTFITGIVQEIFQAFFFALFQMDSTADFSSISGVGVWLLFFIVGLVLYILYSGIVSIFVEGIPYLGARYMAGDKVRLKTAFRGLAKYCRMSLFKLGMGKTLLLCMGYLLLIIPGIYLSLGYLFAGILVIDRGLGWWEALETSRKAVHKLWWKIAGAYGVISLPCIVTFAAIVFFLALLSDFPTGLMAFCAILMFVFIFYLVPANIVLTGALYRKLFSQPTGEETEDNSVAGGK